MHRARLPRICGWEGAGIGLVPGATQLRHVLVYALCCMYYISTYVAVPRASIGASQNRMFQPAGHALRTIQCGAFGPSNFLKKGMERYLKDSSKESRVSYSSHMSIKAISITVITYTIPKSN